MIERRIQSTRQQFTTWFAGRARARVLLEAATDVGQTQPVQPLLLDLRQGFRVVDGPVSA